MTATPAPSTGTAEDPRDPGWVRVGQAIKDDRQRRGMTRGHLVARVAATGGHLTERALALVEQGRIDCKNGTTSETARYAWTALGWTENLMARIKVDGHQLPPLADPRTPRRSQHPAATLTTSLMACRTEQVMSLTHEVAQCVERVRAELIRLSMGLTLPGTTPTEHHAAASRLARHLITTRVTNTLAEVEDSDYTAPDERNSL